jgi:sulfur relay (sulfurtransferase) DsrF/TusC family protein
MENSITNQANYTAVGFKTKAVLEAEVNKQVEMILTTNEKIQTVSTLNMMGQLICSPKFNEYGLDEKVSILNEFAELNIIVKNFK